MLKNTLSFDGFPERENGRITQTHGGWGRAIKKIIVFNFEFSVQANPIL